MDRHGAASTQRFLVIDGYADLVEALQLVIEARGHVVKTAASESSALDALETFSPDVVLLDVRLASGRSEILQRLRGHPNARDARWVALSGGDEHAERAHVRGHGFTAFVRKPFFVGPLLDELVT